MLKLNLGQKIKNLLDVFTEELKSIYKDGLISVILYGSASSGEFVDTHSNLNILVILKDNSLESIKKAAGLSGKFKFRMFSALFFTEEFMRASCDVFPIEFIDIKENYKILYGRDVLEGMTIDLKNLRFQCEHELKSRLIYLKQRYLALHKDRSSLQALLFKSATSVSHILRNVLRLKGKEPAYLKEEVLRQISGEFKINAEAWGKILAAKSKKIRLKAQDSNSLFNDFIKDLEAISVVLDRL